MDQAGASDLNLLTADVKLLQELLSNGTYKSVDLVQIYAAQINKYNGYLRAALQVTPDNLLKAAAQKLDDERKAGNIRGPLHGIPILIKDNVATHPSLGLRTTAGSLALFDSKPAKNAKIIDQLLEAGAIIIGKANLSELSNWKGSGISSGWSAVGGQTQTAYVKGGVKAEDGSEGQSNPSGSSSGSAVGVSAGYAPISIGTETDGSLVSPAGRAGLYTIKPTIGEVAQEGIVPISPNFDSAGPMTKTPYDLAVVLDAIIDPSSPSRKGKSFTTALQGSWGDLKVGVLDPKKWTLPESRLAQKGGVNVQIVRDVKAAYGKIQAKAKTFHENVTLATPASFNLNGVNTELVILIADHKKAMNSYLAALKESPVRTLAELIQFNKDHADKELPKGKSNQSFLERSQISRLNPVEYETFFKHMRKASRDQGIDKILKEFDLDVIIGPGDSLTMNMAAAAGYPIAAMPLSTLEYNGRPFGVTALAGAHQEMALVRVMHAWHAMFAPRPVPDIDAVVSSK